MDGAATTECKNQASGSDEIAVEDLEKRNETNGKDHANEPDGVRAVLEGNGGGEAAAEETLPGRNIRDGANGKNIETSADEQSHGDGLEEISWRKTRVRFLGDFGDGFEAGDEIRNDLERQKDGSEWGVAKERPEVNG